MSSIHLAPSPDTGSDPVSSLRTHNGVGGKSKEPVKKHAGFYLFLIVMAAM